MRFLGLDAGGSATRWAVCDAAGGPLGAGELPATSGHLFRAEERARFMAMTEALAAQVGAVQAVVAGMTGLTAEAPEAAAAAEILAAGLHLPRAAVAVHDDLWIAYHAVFAPGEGHVVYAGTGSIGLHVRADGTAVRVGGWGMLIDDGGSAYWIGREALRQVWRARDFAPGATGPLAVALEKAIGGSGWNATRAYVYGGSRADVAVLAMAVAASDDPVAREILTRAGGELARLAQALIAQAGDRPVALTGRAAMLHPAIAAGFRAAAPDVALRVTAEDAALSAARLAAGCGAGQVGGDHE